MQTPQRVLTTGGADRSITEDRPHKYTRVRNYFPVSTYKYAINSISIENPAISLNMYILPQDRGDTRTARSWSCILAVQAMLAILRLAWTVDTKGHVPILYDNILDSFVIPRINHVFLLIFSSLVRILHLFCSFAVYESMFLCMLFCSNNNKVCQDIMLFCNVIIKIYEKTNYIFIL